MMKIGRADEGVEIEIEPPLVTFMLQFPELLDQIERGDDDPAAQRLDVPVYLDDAEANDEYWALMSSELDRSREADRSAFREVMEAAKGGTVASREEAYAMVRVLNEARLALAARFGVDTEDDYERLDDSEHDILQALGELQMALLWALTP
jgi:hypothetical protein